MLWANWPQRFGRRTAFRRLVAIAPNTTFFMNGGREFDSDVRDPKYASFYGPAHAGSRRTGTSEWTAHPDAAYLDDWLARTAEIVEKYHPELVWFDWWINTKEFEPYLQRFAAFYYNDAAKSGYSGSNQLQIQGVSGQGRGARHRTRPARCIAAAVLANRYVGQHKSPGAISRTTLSNRRNR